MPKPEGFEYSHRKNGDIVITHRGAVAITLRRRSAEVFLRRLDRQDPQEAMARATGNYKRGDEKGRNA